MPRLYHLNELNDVSPAVAWKLVDTQFQQTRSLAIGAGAFVFVGLAGFIGTGSIWYLGGSGAIAAICAIRVGLAYIYKRSRHAAPAITWARRSLWAAWTTAACWGIWGGAAILFQPDKILLLMVVGTQSAALIAAAVRACAVAAVAQGQIFLTLAPLFIACLASGNLYLIAFSLPIAMHAVAALSLAKFMHAQTVQLLLRNEEKSELLAGLEIARQELEIANTHLEGLVLTDALTGVANRRAFDAVAAREWRRSMREDTTLAVLMIDVDHFKSYNDVHGHQAGDLCLRAVAGTIASALRRPGDCLARYGGEEFAVILPRTDLQGACYIGESIVQAFAALAMPHDPADPGSHVTVSIGAAALAASPEMTVEHLTALADSALYAAKRGGRNRVCVAEAAEAPLAAVHMQI